MNCALVTGASRGIGKATAIALSALGYHILINYRNNRAEALNTLTKIEAHGGTGELIPFDVTDKAEVDAAIDKWSQDNVGSRIAVLVNNAGIKNDSLMLWMQDEQWNTVINTSLNGFFFVTRKVLMSMITAKFGRIVNIVSVSGLKGLAGQTNYSAAKAGVIGATKALAQEVARRGVTVNAVAPGFIRTDMTADMPVNELVKTIPVQRFGEPEEVAELVAFLVSDKAAYITGEVISINGGLY
jgi:3-oxoacyl-[acyl-carrier protein] reductase